MRNASANESRRSKVFSAMLGNVEKTSKARVAQVSLLTCITEPKRFGRGVQFRRENGLRPTDERRKNWPAKNAEIAKVAVKTAKNFGFHRRKLTCLS